MTTSDAHLTLGARPQHDPGATLDAANPSRTVREETFALLRALRLTTIFGNPGSTELPFLAGFPDDFHYVLGLHEAAVVAMADGYAQATRRPVLVNLHTAVGLGNAMGNIITAHANKTPLVILAGQQVRAMMLLEPWLHHRQATEVPQPYVKWSYEPARPQDVPAALARAIYTAVQPPAGPVFVSVPKDDWSAPAEPCPPRQLFHQMAPDPAGLQCLATSLMGSRQPAFVVGAGVDRSGGWHEMIGLAEHARAAVWSAPASGRASFPEDHALFQGFLPLAQAPLADALAPYDVIVVIGAPVFAYYPYVPGPVVYAGTQLFHITDDPAEAARAPAGTSIIGDVAQAVRQLRTLLPATSRTWPAVRPAPPPPFAPVAAAATQRNNDSPSQEPMSAAFVVHALAQALPTNAIIFEEAPSYVALLQTYLRIKRSGGYYSGASGGLGWALPAAVGVQLAQPNRRSVCLLGDGSSLYSIQALWTAAQHDLPIVCVVLNNSQYGILKAFAAFEDLPGPFPGLDLPALDLVSIAQGLGCAAQRVESPTTLAEALQVAFASSRPCVLDVQIDPAVPALL